MKRGQHGTIFSALLFILLAFTGTPLAFECVGPATQNCLQCHVRADIHSFHLGQIQTACSQCHCGDPGSACGQVETQCCTNCHSLCYEVDKHIPRGGACTACHASTNTGIDDDCDGICNPGIVDPSCSGSDNCPSNPNGPALGTCTKEVAGRTCVQSNQCGTHGFCNTNQEDVDIDGLGDVCDPDADNDGILNNEDVCAYDAENDIDTDDICGDVDNCPSYYNPIQEDSYPPPGNSCGDLCECEGNFDGDTDVDGSDVAKFKGDFGRGIGGKNICTDEAPCNGDFTCDVDVDGSDVALFKVDFGRGIGGKNTCPSCVTDPWCDYP